MKSNKIRLGEQCVVTSSKRFHLSERITQGVPFYCSKEIIKKFNGEDVTECDYISEDLYKKVSNEFGVPKENDLLITTRGTIGIPYLYKRTDRFYFADGNLTWIKDFDSNLYSKFLYYWFQSYEGRKKFEALAKGTAQKAVPISGIKTLEIELPSLKSQKRIADILSAYDDLIENNQKQIKLLEEAAQRLYKEWFVDLRFPGHENTKIVDGVPEGWSKSMVSEVSAVLRRGISPKYNEKARGIVINQKCIRQTIVSYDEARTQEKKYPAELEMMESDIVICSTGAGTLGRVGQIFEAKGNATLDSHVTLIRANEKIGQQYLFWSLKMQQDYLMSAGKGSTNQLELSRETIGNCKILIPEQKIAEQAEKNFAAIHDKMKECSMRIARLREVRDLLLPKLMSGEVEV